MYIVFSLVVYVYISVYLCMSIYPNNTIINTIIKNYDGILVIINQPCDFAFRHLFADSNCHFKLYTNSSLIMHIQYTYQLVQLQVISGSLEQHCTPGMSIQGCAVPQLEVKLH